MQVRIKVTYFKASGKYYSGGEFECEASIIPKDAPPEAQFIYLYDVLDAYRKLVADTKEAPGLNSNGKSFHKLFEAAVDKDPLGFPESGHTMVPHLIPAEEEDT